MGVSMNQTVSVSLNICILNKYNNYHDNMLEQKKKPTLFINKLINQKLIAS